MNLIRVLGVLLTLLCWLPALAASARHAQEQPNITLSADERAWLAQKHTVRVRIGEAPPWEINHPEPAGMAVDYLRIIAKLFDIDFRSRIATGMRHRPAGLAGRITRPS